ncbi:MAG: hypothetical protein CVU72_05835 [Deltaproteobacteria bacterium HGW-Deltaproteobacteria-7]|nr:MAG: hypothetical protein CVU72_05835 [Deltaproteobacteria bacterium HGW-Deltaproteobacteria-7]
MDIELGEKFRMRFGNAIREVQERAKPLLPKGIPGVDMPPYEQSQKIVEKTPLPPNYAPPSISSYKYLYSLAEISARSAIIEAWVEIELSVLQLHETKENLSSSSQIISTTIIVGKLAEQKVIGDDTFTLFEELRHLRNQVVHAVDYQPLAEQAKAYIDLALRLVAFFRNLHLKIVEDSQRDRK